MNFNKNPSFIAECMAWIIRATIAAGLALPLIAFEYNIDINQTVADIITPPINESTLVATNNANYQLPTKLGSSSGKLGFLQPDLNLLPSLSEQRRARLKFSEAMIDFEEMIEDTAREHQVSPVLVKAVIQAESGFNPGAISHKGAVGLMQVMPTTARRMGIHDPGDPQKNIVAGVKYLKILLEMYNDDERLAIAAYNCGPDALKRFNNQVPPFRETITFVDKVMSYYNQHLHS